MWSARLDFRTCTRPESMDYRTAGPDQCVRGDARGLWTSGTLAHAAPPSCGAQEDTLARAQRSQRTRPRPSLSAPGSHAADLRNIARGVIKRASRHRPSSPICPPWINGLSKSHRRIDGLRTMRWTSGTTCAQFPIQLIRFLVPPIAALMPGPRWIPRRSGSATVALRTCSSEQPLRRLQVALTRRRERKGCSAGSPSYR